MLIEWGRQQNAKLVVVGRNLCALKHVANVALFNAEKSVGGKLKVYNFVVFQQNHISLAVRCRTFQTINL